MPILVVGLYAAQILTLGVVLYWLPRWSRPETFFGITVPGRSKCAAGKLWVGFCYW